MAADYVIVAERDTSTGGRQVTVATPDGKRITVRVPPAQSTGPGVQRAIETALATRQQSTARP